MASRAKLFFYFILTKLVEVGVNLGHCIRYPDSNIMCPLSVIFHERPASALEMFFLTLSKLEYLIITDAHLAMSTCIL
jgi:hypothetical protein